MDRVNIKAYIEERRHYGGFWSGLNAFFESKRQVFTRMHRLHAARYRYVAREEYVPPEPPPASADHQG